jgi:hypothetical protein
MLSTIYCLMHHIQLHVYTIPTVNKSLNAFLAGWRSLPDELKLHVLRYVLPSNETYSESDFRGCKYYPTNFLSLLSVEQCKDLALEVLYGQNTVYITHSRAENTLPGTEWPPKYVFQHIKSIELYFRHIGSSILDLLRNIVDGTANIAHLHSLKLHICSGCLNIDSRNAFAAIEVMEFPTRVLEVKYRHSIINLFEKYVSGPPYDTSEMVFLDKFTV